LALSLFSIFFSVYREREYKQEVAAAAQAFAQSTTQQQRDQALAQLASAGKYQTHTLALSTKAFTNEPSWKNINYMCSDWAALVARDIGGNYYDMYNQCLDYFGF